MEQNKISTQTPTFSLRLQKHPLSEPTEHKVSVGVSVSDIRKKAPVTNDVKPLILVNGENKRGNYKPRKSDTVTVTFVPQIAEMTVTQLLLTAAVSTVVGFALGTIFAPDIEQQGLPEENKFERIRGLRNKERLYEAFIGVLGKRKVAPTYIARPYTTIEGETEYFHALLSAGYGPLKLENFRIGETPLSEFEHQIAVLDHFENTDESAVQQMWQSDINQQAINQNLDVKEGWTTVTSATDPVNLESQFLFPRGVFRLDRSNRKDYHTSCVQQQYQDDNGDWVHIAEVGDYVINLETGFIRSRFGQIFQHPKNSGNWRKYTTDNVRFSPADTTQLNENSEPLPGTPVVSILEMNPDGVTGLAEIRGVSPSFVCTSLSYRSQTQKQAVRALRYTPTFTGQKSVRTRKVFPDDEDEGVSDVSWETIQTVRPLSPQQFKVGIGGNRPHLRYGQNVVENFRPTVIALRLKASGQLNGTLDNFFVDATMCVPQDKDADWRDWPSLPLEPSTSPADAYKWLLQGPMNYSPVPIEKVNHENLAEWRTRCLPENDDWRISALIDYESTLLSELNNVAYTGRGEFSFNDGKFGVIEKIKRTIPTQVFTPKNSANFQSTRTYPEEVDGIKFEFENAAVDYETDEAIFLDPNKQSNPQLLRGRYTSSTLWGVDNHEQAYRLVRFKYYETFLQRETYTLDADIEALVCKRGNLVRIQNDLIDVGYGSGRVKSIDGNTVVIDEQIGLENITTEQLGLQFRDKLGVFHTSEATYLGNGEWEVLNLSEDISVGDLAVYGLYEKETLDCIVKQIEYNEDLGAKLTLVNAANEIFDFEGDPVPEYNSGLTPPPELATLPTPTLIAADIYDGGDIIGLSVNRSIFGVGDRPTFFVQVRSYPRDEIPDEYFSGDEDGWEFYGSPQSNSKIIVIEGLERGFNYEFRVQYSLNGSGVSPFSNVVSAYVNYGIALKPVEGLQFEHTKQGTLVTFDRQNNPALDSYEWRYDNDFGEQTEELIQLSKTNSINIGYISEETIIHVAAKNPYDEYTDGRTITIQPPSVLPPSSVNVTEDLPKELNWLRPEIEYPVAYFEVRYANSGTSSDGDSATRMTDINGETVIITVPSVGTYDLFIRTVDEGGNLSDWVSVTNIEIERISERLDQAQEEIDQAIEDIDGLGRRNFDIPDINAILEEISQDATEIFRRREDVNTEKQRRIQNFTQLEVEIQDVSVATNTRIDEVEVDVDGNATAISGLQLNVQNLDTDLSSTINRVDQVEIDSGNNASAISVVQGQVNDPENNTSALYGFVQQAQTTADGNASSIAALTTRVENNENFADAQLILNSEFDSELGNLSARAFLGTNVNGQVTGINIEDVAGEQRIDFQSNAVAFLDSSGQEKIFFDTQAGRYIFDGTLVAADGVFTGTLTGVDGDFTGTITASSGNIGGWVITPTRLRSANSTGQRIELYPSELRIAGYNSSNQIAFRLEPNIFTVGTSASDRIQWTPAAGLEVTGKITASDFLGGTIGIGGASNDNFIVDSDGNITQNGGYYRTADVSSSDVRVLIDGRTSGDYAIFVGVGGSTDSNAIFGVKKNGNVIVSGDFKDAVGVIDPVSESSSNSSTASSFNQFNSGSVSHTSKGKVISLSANGQIYFAMTGNTIGTEGGNTRVRIQVRNGTSVIKTEEFAAPGWYDSGNNRTLYGSGGSLSANFSGSNGTTYAFNTNISLVNGPTGSIFSASRSASIESLEQ